MKAMILEQLADLTLNQHPLVMVDRPIPEPGPGQVLLHVLACGVCHTELDEIEGRTPPPSLPMILGHQVVGRVEAAGRDVRGLSVGDRVGVGWIYSACGHCRFCNEGRENLCPDYLATGRDADGGYAEYMLADSLFAYPVPDVFSDAEAAPLLCAGAIGLRSLRLTEIKNGDTLGLTGFGASAHLVLKLVRNKFPDTRVHVFARNPKEREFALELGAVWAGDTADRSPEQLRAIIDTTPVWKPVVEAMDNLAPGGRLVINAIRKESADIAYLQEIDYARHLWMEKEIKSVANVAGSDIRDFLLEAARIPIRPEVEEFPLADANRALTELKAGQIRGAKVLVMP